MKYAVQMGLGAILYILSFIKIGSGIRKFMGGGAIHTHRDTQTARQFHKPIFIFSR
jgi:hypothetical protein